MNAYTWPAFSIDGREILVAWRGAGALTADGTGFRWVAGDSYGAIGQPAVAPLGANIASCHWCDSTSTVTSIWLSPFAASTDSCRGRRITPVDGFDSERATWGSDSIIAYHRVDRAAQRAVIAMASAVESQTCILTPEQEDSRNPSWSP
jgi:hypothetical protein